VATFKADRNKLDELKKQMSDWLADANKFVAKEDRPLELPVQQQAAQQHTPQIEVVLVVQDGNKNGKRVYADLVVNEDELAAESSLVLQKNGSAKVYAALDQLKRDVEKFDAHEVVIECMTLLTFACYKKYNNIVKKILKNCNVDVNWKDKDEDSALHVACMSGNVEAIKLLLLHPDIQVDRINSRGKTPEKIALQEGYVNIAEMLRKFKKE